MTSVHLHELEAFKEIYWSKSMWLVSVQNNEKIPKIPQSLNDL